MSHIQLTDDSWFMSNKPWNFGLHVKSFESIFPHIMMLWKKFCLRKYKYIPRSHMDAVKKLPPSRRFLKHNLPKSPAKKDVKSASTKPGTKSTTKSPAKKSQKSQIKKPCRKLNHETTCPEENPLVAPRQGPPYRRSILYGGYAIIKRQLSERDLSREWKCMQTQLSNTRFSSKTQF